MGNSSSSRLAGIGDLVSEIGSDVQYERSMGSSRFLKSIRARHPCGVLVVKTFVKEDTGISLRPLVRRLRVEREALANVPNVLAYQTVIETREAGYVIRQWLASSLYDRISTRPFLSTIEKKWITYQLIHAMRDARAAKVPHGDLKCENILVTSSLSIYITDFAASFKPVYLPLDDPADFNFFYDTSGRRSCYVAPERFYSADSQIAQQRIQARREANAKAAKAAGSSANAAKVPISSTNSSSITSSGDPYAEILGIGNQRDGKVTEAMDVFSLGCVIAELWRDGKATFNLSQLYKYRERQLDMGPALEEIEVPEIRALVKDMISLDPSVRGTFASILSKTTGSGEAACFPAIFPEHLHPFLTDLQRVKGPPVAQSSGANNEGGGSGASVSTAAPLHTISNSNAVPNLPYGLGTILRTEADERIERIYDQWPTLIRQLLQDAGEPFTPKETADDTFASAIPEGAKSPAPAELMRPHRTMTLAKNEALRGEVDPKVAAILSTLAIPGLTTELDIHALRADLHSDGTALIFLSVITANIRNCLRPSSKTRAIDMLMHLSCLFLSDEAKLDRVLPFLIALVDDDAPVVRAQAVTTCAQLCQLVRKITPSNALVFPEYIFPNLRHLCGDLAVGVRCALASSIFTLEQEAQRFLDMASALKAESISGTSKSAASKATDNDTEGSGREAQKEALMSFVHEQVTALLTDSSPSVKRALLAQIEPLCRLFGPTRTNDVLLSHMITYLNDRNWLLRDAFFDIVVTVASTTGAQSLEAFILPLMTQALADAEEMIIARVLLGFARLAQAGLLSKVSILDLTAGSIGFLAHPNQWIREAAIAFFVAISHRLSVTDTWSILYPAVRPLLRSDIPAFTEFSLRSTLVKPLRRSVLNAALTWAASSGESQYWKPPADYRIRLGLAEGLAREGVKLMAGHEMSEHVKETLPANAQLQKMRSSGLTGEEEVQLIAMREYLFRRAHQSNGGPTTSKGESTSGPYPLVSGLETQKLEGITAQTIFFTPTWAQLPIAADPNVRSHLDAVYSKMYRERHELGGSSSMHRRSNRHLLRAPRAGGHRRPEGSLVAYFTEHTASITSIAVAPDHTFFATGAEDGTVKIWDTARLERNVTSRSRATYAAQKGAITCIIPLENSHCIASAAVDGSVHIWRVDATFSSTMPKYGKIKLVSNFQLSKPGEYVTTLMQSVTENASTLLLGTSLSRITVLDLRTMQVLNTFQNPVQHGPISCLCADTKKHWLLIGTLGGILSLWDMRFGLLLKSWSVGSGQRRASHEDLPQRGTVKITKCVLHPSKGKNRWVMVACESVGASLMHNNAAADRANGDADTEMPSSTPGVMVETWDIDTGTLIETYENADSSTSRSSRPSTEREPLKQPTGASSTNVNSAQHAIERLLQQRRSEVEGDDQQLLPVEEEASDEENKEPDVTQRTVRDRLKKVNTIRAGAKAMVVGLEGYASSSAASTSTANANAIGESWIDAGKLAAEANGRGSGGSTGAGPQGFMICAGEDKRIRFWDLGRTEKSVSIAGVDDRSEFRTLASTNPSEVRHVHTLNLNSSMRYQSKSPLLAHQQTPQAYALARAHTDAITSLAVLEAPFRCIVAGDRRGTIRVWQ
ncbi:Serine/threonine-protein kinase [Tilletia horrida]|nr:Serine/threonine-protein kinase [Tilletia horrida]KAK0567971.1 Serine/threonine-protein kinase [Tilletia horrida]